PKLLLVRKGLLRPTGITGIPRIVSRIAISAAPVDEECASYCCCRERTPKRPNVIRQILAIKAGIVEHDNDVCWRCFLIEDRKHRVGWIALEAIAPFGPFLEEEIVAHMADNPLGTVGKEYGHR